MGEMEQERHVVAFLGPKASYTHQATISHFNPKFDTLLPQTTIEDVFSAVHHGRATHGIVPFENSSNGSVVFTLDLFADTAGRYYDIVVAGEIFLPVRHCLLGRINHEAKNAPAPTTVADVLSKQHLKDDLDSPALLSGQVTPTQSQPTPPPARTKPLTDLTHIKKIYSHPQAWGQCKAFLNTYLKHAERQDVSSTSRAAELIASEKTSTSAAISSSLAAELNGLDFLAEGIEDSEGNSTRFFILRRLSTLTASKSSAQLLPADSSGTDLYRWKTLISFSIAPSARSGALADALAVFKKHNLNMTSINTRPSGLAPWHYVFFVEVWGRRHDVGVEGEAGPVNKALEELERVVANCRWLGSWERGDAVKEGEVVPH